MVSRSTALTRILLPALLGLLGIVMILMATGPGGPGVSSDAAYYLSVADNLAAGEGFLRMDGEPLSAWPPLYPMILSIAPASGGDPLQLVTK